MNCVDLQEPRHVGCGTILPVRSSRLAAIYYYDYDPTCSPRRVDDKVFDLNCILITTRGGWQIHGIEGKADVDETVMPLGVLGDSYGCRHNSGGNASYIVTLAFDALDADYGRLFEKSIIPSQGALPLVARALRAGSDEAFDSAVFTLFHEASSVSTQNAPIAFSRLQMQRAKRFIEFNAFEEIGLSDIAREVGLSPFTVLRQFRCATGKTPYAYLLEIRLERAKQLLEDGTMPVRSVGLAVGFPDIAYFSRFFKSRTGMSPLEYRRAVVRSMKP
jgi:AraC-like DNA-binding protein